ncbi:hypothetical protein [Parapedobacter koreensis]|uniref:Outer membrane protein beta-barrel domain-containing protein n=1 Tax=Parapedobacter koreensis TaxID=332977 RepID=A0A1H7TVW1_9SPHI|nr:hypothetical protein [Parapedobacter koreensis]SEL88628.1 hypothetical protein SAMN05421740_112107 [Parapedobacter koreensis]
MKTIHIIQKTAGKISLLLAPCLIGCLLALQAYAQPASSQADTSAASTSNPLPRWTFNINPLGLLQFGPIAQGEFKISKQGYLVPHIRIPYLGVLYHVVNWDDQSDDVAVSPLALGLGAGYKTLFPVEKGAWYVGGALDYSFGSSTGYDMGDWESHFQNIAIMSNGGFRWRSATKRSVLSVGAYVGVSLPIQDEWSGSSGSGDDRTVLPMAMLELSFGWEHK